MALGGGANATAITVAAALTAVSVLANIMVISVHALDGSEETDRLGRWLARSAARRPGPTGCTGRRPGSIMWSRCGCLRRRESPRAASRGPAGIALADQTIDNARAIHQGAGSLSEDTDDPNGQPGAAGYRQPAAIPRVDERPLRHALMEASSPLPSETG